MPLKNLFFSIVCSLTLFACSSSDEVTEIITGIPEGTNLRVNFFRQLCFGEGQFQCLQVQQGEQLGSNEWSDFFGGIDGFEFEGGFIYNLEVRTRTIDNPPSDGSSLAYELVREISREAVSCSFENPAEDLPWLKTEIEFRTANPNEESQYCYITQAEFNNTPVFIYRDCNPFVNKIDLVLNCFGDDLGYVGGEGVDFSELTDERLVWSPNPFACTLDL